MNKAFWLMCAIFAIIVTITVALGANIIINGMVLGVFILFSVGFGYIFLSRGFKRFVMWGPNAFLMDLVLSWGITYAMGWTLTGFTAGIVFGLLLSIVIKFERLRLWPQ